MFSWVAKGKGKVTEVTPVSLVIQYDDPALGTETVPLGREYGVMTGTTLPHDLVTDLTVGSDVGEGDIVMWNSGFFTRDFFNPKQVTWMNGALVQTVLWEGPSTYEDSNVISAEVARELETNTTQVRELSVDFTQGVRNLVNPGDELDIHDVLCYIEDSVTAGTRLFDEQTLEKLGTLARNAPKAKYAGKVGRVEVLYNGDVDDMTESLREIVLAANRRRAKESRLRGGKAALTGRVEDLELDKVVIKVYIDSTLGSADGDKIVFCNQMKTVTRGVYHTERKAESGALIGAEFSYRSVNARMVESALLQGTLTTLLKHIGELAAQAYRS